MRKFSLFAAGLIACGAASAQTPPAPGEAAPAAPDETVAPAPAKPQWLLYRGSFEAPHVLKRTPKEQGGNPVVKFGRREWIRFDHKMGDKGGVLTAGITNETGHTGHQSLYFEFSKLTAPIAKAELASDMISIRPSESYHVSIWGRIDKANPLTLDQRIPSLQLHVEFFQADKDTQTGETEVRTQPIPGSPNRRPFFTAEAWSEYAADLTSPEDAAYMRVTWSVATPPQEGQISGTVFFDDANVKGVPGKTLEEIDAETPDPAEPAAGTEPAAVAEPAAPATKK